MLIEEEPTSNLPVLTCASSELNSVPTNSTFRPSLPATAVSRSLSKPVNLPSLRKTLGGASVSVPTRIVPACCRPYGLSFAAVDEDALLPQAESARTATAAEVATSERRTEGGAGMALPCGAVRGGGGGRAQRPSGKGRPGGRPPLTQPYRKPNPK